MKRKILKPIKLSFVCLLTLFNIISLYQSVDAHPHANRESQTNRESKANSSRNNTRGNNNSFRGTQLQSRQKQKNASDRGRPGRRRGMATRDSCPSTDIPLTALIPENNIGKVVEENPTFWLFVPYEANKVPVGEFVLQDEDNKDIYRKKILTKKAGGVVSVNLDSQISLKTNKVYQWYFKLYCNTSNDSQKLYRDTLSSPIYVRGWVQRVTPPGQQKENLNTSIPSSQDIDFYTKNDIWYSALDKLAKLRQANPQNQKIAKEWSQLLGKVGLQDVSDKPIVGNIN
ncbi:MAG: DUF928 domain-containing protein [Mastigocoleus sp.]